MPKRYAQLSNIDWLSKQATIKTLQQIANDIGCTYLTVLRVFKKYNIQHGGTRHPCPPQLNDRHWLVETWKIKTKHQIAQNLQCAESVVGAAIKRLNIEAPRPPGQPPAPACLQDREYISTLFPLFTTHEIAAQLHCAQITVLRALYKLGIFEKGSGKPLRNAPYRHLKGSNGKYRGEHCIIMEKHLGRPLLSTEVVHHIDGNSHNNNLDNLIVMTINQHSSLHNKCENKVCEKCGSTFKGRQKEKYCPSHK